MEILSKRKRKAKRLKIAYDRTFSSEDGREVLLDLMESVGITGPSLDYNNPNSLTMAFNDGAKSIVHRIIEQVNMDTEAYLQTIEQKQKSQEDFNYED